jgi:hypothetical protein
MIKKIICRIGMCEWFMRKAGPDCKDRLAMAGGGAGTACQLHGESVRGVGAGGGCRRVLVVVAPQAVILKKPSISVR